MFLKSRDGKEEEENKLHKVKRDMDLDLNAHTKPGEAEGRVGNDYKVVEVNEQKDPVTGPSIVVSESAYSGRFSVDICGGSGED